MISGERRIVAVMLSSALVLGVLGVAVPSTAAATAHTTADCTIFVVDGVATGTEGDDIICGTAGDDVIFGLGGNDTVFGLGGDDYIDTAAGNDWVSAGYGDDEVHLGVGDDYTMGGPGADGLWGDAGGDELDGWSGDDSIVGGSGADDVDGGTGVDYCRKDTGDIQKSCYFDTSAPSLVSIALGTPTVSTTYADRVVAVRFRVADKGTGLARVSMEFARRLPSGSTPNKVDFQAGTAFAEQFCTASRHAPTPPKGESSICLVSGTPQAGVYEMRSWIPRWAPTGTYRLMRVAMWDAAGNRRSLPWDTLVERRLSVSFKQIGPGDSVAPVVRAVEVLTPSVSTTDADQLVGARIHVTDALSGLSGLYLEWGRVKRVDGVVVKYLWPFPAMHVNPADAPDCGPDLPAVADIKFSATPYCLESGTLKDGWYRAWGVFPQWVGKGTYDLVSISVGDRAGNSRLENPDEVPNHPLANSIEQTGPGDETAPVVTSVTVDTPSVSTGSQEAEVRFTVTATDALSGVASIDLEFAPASNPTQVGLDAFAGSDPCSEAIDFCLVSGTLNNGVWTTSGFLPAHAPAGTWTLWRVTVTDRSGNIRQTSGTAFGASFTNS